MITTGNFVVNLRSLTKSSTQATLTPTCNSTQGINGVFVVGSTNQLEVKNSSPHVLVTGDLNSTSDARLKENVEPIANALSDITQLEGVSFDWKDTGTRGHGFIAQQVEPILPDVVQTDDETGIKSINYVGMIGHLVEAIKELKAEIEELKRQ